MVHGGGPEITDMLKKIGKESKFVNGLRYTDRETMDIVQMVLCARSTRIWSPCWKRRAAAASVWAAWTRHVSGQAPDRPHGHDYGYVATL